MHIANETRMKRIKHTRKTNLLKNLDVVVMEKQLQCIYLFPSVLFFVLPI